MKKFILFCFLSLTVWSEEIPPKYLKLLEKIVNINTGTGNFTGAEKVRAILRSHLFPLGFKESKSGDPKGHQVFSYETDHTSPKKILLYGHLDTVFSKESPFQKIRIDQDKIYGPGVIDMKGGIVLIIHLLENLKNQPKILNQIKVVFSDDEETISTIGAPLIDEFAKDIPYGLIFEPGLKNGAVVTSHSGVHWLDLNVSGKAAHAGLAHKDGVNACVELGDKIFQLSKLTNYSKGLTVSPDVIQGGTKTNIVCDSAHALIDIRFIQNNDLKKLLQDITELLKDKKVKSFTTSEQANFDLREVAHMSALTSPSTDILFAMAKNASASAGINLTGEHVGYGTDAGHLAQLGMQVLVGVGPYGEGMHTDHEYMLIKSYQERLQMNMAIIENITKVTPSN